MKIAAITNLLSIFDREKSVFSYIKENDTVAAVRSMVSDRVGDEELKNEEVTKLKQLLSGHIEQNGQQDTATGRFVLR